MFRISAEVNGAPLPKERQIEILIDMLHAVQKDYLGLTGAVFSQGTISISAEVLATEVL